MRGKEENKAGTGGRQNWKQTMDLKWAPYNQKAGQQYDHEDTGLESPGQEIKKMAKRELEKSQRERCEKKWKDMQGSRSWPWVEKRGRVCKWTLLCNRVNGL